MFVNGLSDVRAGKHMACGHSNPTPRRQQIPVSSEDGPVIMATATEMFERMDGLLPKFQGTMKGRR
jgi:hypothetical protein